MNPITNAILLSWTSCRKTHKTPSGWISGDAVCCDDHRGRGGLIISGDTVSWHCFNCTFKASWAPGMYLSQAMRKLLSLMYVPGDTISRLTIESLKYINDTNDQSHIESHLPSFTNKFLPKNSRLITDWIKHPTIDPELIAILEYLQRRHLFLDDYQFYWSNEPRIKSRIIIPYFYHKNIVGYTARDVTNKSSARYLADQQPGYVFNLDEQLSDKKFIILCEGPFDAISIGGCALLGSELKEGQINLLNAFNKPIIVVPDRDAAGKKLVNTALEQKWAVSMPEWDADIKDINDAVIRYGRLATLWSIIDAQNSNPLAIKINANKWYHDGKY